MPELEDKLSATKGKQKICDLLFTDDSGVKSTVYCVLFFMVDDGFIWIHLL